MTEPNDPDSRSVEPTVNPMPEVDTKLPTKMTQQDSMETQPIQGDWVQAETPGSKVTLEKVPDPTNEPTTQILTSHNASANSDQSEVGVQPSNGTLTDLAYSSGPTVTNEVERSAQEAAAERAAARAAQLVEERAARNRALGVVSPTGAEIGPPPKPAKLVTDKFFGSLGLFILRIVVATVLGVRGYQMVTEITSVKEYLTASQIPAPAYVAWSVAITLLVVALTLLLGLLVRVSGFALLVLMILTLVFVRWGAFNPFIAGQAGFIGDMELLLAGVALVFCCLGGGRWGLDGAYRTSRAKAKAAAIG